MWSFLAIEVLGYDLGLVYKKEVVESIVTGTLCFQADISLSDFFLIIILIVVITFKNFIVIVEHMCH